MAGTDIGVAPPKGFRDFLPRETELRDRTLSSILQVYRSYGFERVETPAIEDLRRLQKSDGGENLGLLFRILKRGDKLDLNKANLSAEDLVDLGLRYDLTVPLSRYYANNRNSLPSVFKAVQVGPVWRAERPQAGRFRQFVQCDIDVIGGAAPAIESELLSATQEALSTCGITGLKIRINDRRILSAMVSSSGIPEARASKALVLLDKLDKIGINGVEQEFIKDGFDVESISRLIALANSIQNMPEDSRLAGTKEALLESVPASVFESLTEIIQTVKINLIEGNSVSFDPFLVRGMGYYTGAVFEISHSDFGGSIAGGGRYDKLIGQLSGTDATACGFSIGFERIISILEQRSNTSDQAKCKVAIFYDNQPGQLIIAMQVARKLRSGNNVASVFETPKNMKAMLERLKQVGYSGFVRAKAEEEPTIKPI